jgi:acyl carrier protein/NAD(P)-dependent dehydrogenase (short-subunit alcohol dehydrogenase family)
MGDAAAAAIRAIERTGAAVTIARADISVAADADSLFADVLSKLPPLRGVIHAAGVLDDALIAHQSLDRLRGVMAPKVRGTWNLHLHTRALPLDFFVCYSSAASLVGSPGQANYAAGNACMDAIAHHRRALGLPASSINWGAWGEEGMAANPQMHARLAARGVTPIATSDGLALLSRLLREDDAERPTVFGVMPVAWRTFLKQFPADVPSRFEMLASAASEAEDASSAPASSEADSSNAAASSASVLALRALTANDRRRRLQQMLRDTLAAVLGFGASVELGPREKYFELGMDSLLSVEFRNRLQQTFAITLPATLAFDYPTIETLAEHIDALLAEHFRSSDSSDSNGSNDSDRSDGSGRSHDSTPEELDALATDEIARLLAAELSEEAVRAR